MRGTMSLLGLSLVTVVAGWTIQALQPTPTDIAARHYGLILIDNPASDFKMKSRLGQQAKVEATSRLEAASFKAAAPDGGCAGPLRCEVANSTAE